MTLGSSPRPATHCCSRQGKGLGSESGLEHQIYGTFVQRQGGRGGGYVAPCFLNKVQR